MPFVRAVVPKTRLLTSLIRNSPRYKSYRFVGDYFPESSNMTSDSFVPPSSLSPEQFRDALDNTLRRRFFFASAFEAYGGVSGLYDYGPAGCALQANIVDIWRRHFVLEEDLLEVDTTMLTPYSVLKTSGHVDKFADWMCKDPKTGEIFRADHLVEEVLESRLAGDKEARGIAAAIAAPDAKKKLKGKVKKITEKLDDAVVKEIEEVLAKIDNYSGPELGELIQKYKITNPTTGGALLPPAEFNLMFATSIGASGTLKGFLRPETAQGQFLNFNKLLDFNQDKMPFGSASIGKSFRNEISPRSGLLRVREFLMAEIEYFVDPNAKEHPRFSTVENLEIRLLPKGVQERGESTIMDSSIGKAVADGIVDNTTLGYFIARIHLFLITIGVNPKKLRFRQHMSNEMAHYACDCWDAELHTTHGWIECVGCADRSAYDLTVHSKATGIPLIVNERLENPVESRQLIPEFNRKIFGPMFKKDAKALEEKITRLPESELREHMATMEKGQSLSITVDDVVHEVPIDALTISEKLIKQSIREYTPNVIEPSFGIGRILYSVIEHNFWARENDMARGVFSFPICVAPTKCLLVPLSSNEEFEPLTKEIASILRKLNITMKIDESRATIGKRYARNDELGTAYGITVDFQSVKDRTVTLRERDSTNQIRGCIEVITNVLSDLVAGRRIWNDVFAEFGEFTGQVL